MENKLKSVLSGAGFYVLLGVCLVLAAVSGCYLLFGQSQEEEPDYQTLYRTAARTWRGTGSREMRSYSALMDVHAPDKLRGNRALQSLDEFYEAFDIQPGDGMYLPQEARVQIW